MATKERSQSFRERANKGINEHPSYAKVLTREQAELKFKNHEGNCYLTYYDRARKSYVLMVMEGGSSAPVFTEFKIIIDKQHKYLIEGKERAFESYFELIDICFESMFPGKQGFRSVVGNENQISNRSCTNYAIPTRTLKAIWDHPSFHGTMEGSIAALKLREHGGDCFLTRFSMDKSSYRLSVRKEGRKMNTIQHFNIIITPNGSDLDTVCEIERTDVQFNTISKLLTFYQSNPLNHVIDHIGDCVERRQKRENHRSLTPPPLPPRSRSPQIPSHYSREDSNVTYVERNNLTPRPVRRSCSPHIPPSPGPDCNSERKIMTFPPIRSHSPQMSEYPAWCHTGKQCPCCTQDLHIRRSPSPSPPPLPPRQSRSSAQTTNYQPYQNCEELRHQHAYPEVKNAATMTKTMAINIPILGRLPLDMKYLDAIKWRDERGTERMFELVKKVSTKWKTFGLRINLHMNTLTQYQFQMQGNAEWCWQMVMQEWLDGRGQEEYPNTWEGLYKMLTDIQCSHIAEELKTAVENAC